MGKKLTYEEVREYMKNFGYILLSNEYENSRNKLLVECPLGHKYKVGFSDFKKGRRCPHCYNNRRGNNCKLEFEEVKNVIESFGYKLLSDSYKNNLTKLLIECPKGHSFKMRYGGFQQGYRCPKCQGVYKESYQEIKKHIESFGCELLSTECKNVKEKIKLKCTKGHEYEVAYGNFKYQHQRCPYCSGVAKLSYEDVKEYIESFKYQLLSTEYVNNKAKILIECSEGHKYETCFHNFKQGHRCPICNISKGERKIIDWLDKYNIKYVYEKTFDELIGVGGGNLSYDFYLPDCNLLIEYQGEQHEHQIDGFGNFKVQQEHDERKRGYARKNGYELLEIWYWDYNNIEEILEGGILN